MTNPIDELLTAVEDFPRALDAGDVLLDAADRVRAWRARGELTDKDLRDCYDADPDLDGIGAHLSGLRSVARAVRERSS